MRTLLYLGLLVFLLAPEPSLKHIRKLYTEAPESGAKAEALYEKLKTISLEDEPTLVAYKGASMVVLAKFKDNLADKKKFFTDGVPFIEHAVENAPDNLEIRCIRLSIQENIPKILKYKDEMEADKAFLLEHFPDEKSKPIRHVVQDFVKASDSFSEEEKQLFQ